MSDFSALVALRYLDGKGLFYNLIEFLLCFNEKLIFWLNRCYNLLAFSFLKLIFIISLN